MLDLRDLRCFVAVYDAGGFARAAQALDTSQSMISTRVMKLEHFIGVALFDRLPRGAHPTRAGRKLYLHAQRVLAEVDEIETVARDLQAA